MKSSSHHAMQIASVLLASLFVANASAETGVSKDKITLGAFLPMTGPVGPQGSALKRAVELYIKRLNEAGGVFGRKIDYVAIDDGFDPQKTVGITKALIEERKVFAMISPVGTPGMMASLPQIEKSGVIVVAPLAVADRLRFPIIKGMFHLRPGSTKETGDLIKMIKSAGHKKIALFRQDNSLGQATKGAVNKLAVEEGMQFVGEGVVPNNSVAVDDAIKAIAALKADAVVIGVSGMLAAEFVKRAPALGLKSALFASTPAFNKEFFELGGAAAEQVVFNLTVPCFTDDVAVAEQYRKDATAAGLPVDQQAYEGYLAMALMHEGLKRTGKDLTREKLISTFEAMKGADIGGVKVSFSPEDHVGVKLEGRTRFVGGKCVREVAAKSQL